MKINAIFVLAIVLSSLLPSFSFAMGKTKPSLPDIENFQSITLVRAKRLPGLGLNITFENSSLPRQNDFLPNGVLLVDIFDGPYQPPQIIREGYTGIHYHFADEVYVETIKAIQKCEGKEIASQSKAFFEKAQHNSFQELSDAFYRLVDDVGTCLVLSGMNDAPNIAPNIAGAKTQTIDCRNQSVYLNEGINKSFAILNKLSRNTCEAVAVGEKLFGKSYQYDANGRRFNILGKNKILSLLGISGIVCTSHLFSFGIEDTNCKLTLE